MAKKKKRGRDEGAGEVLFQGASKAASKKTEAAAPAATAKASAPKAAAKKGAEAPVKLSASQGELLKKIGGSETGYLAAKKAEQRIINALLEAQADPGGGEG